MRSKTQIIVSILALVLATAAGAARLAAQHSYYNDATKWRSGMLRLSKSAWAGNIRLKRGMYHVKHIVEGDRHWLIFKTVNLGGGHRESIMWEGGEIARMECRVEPAMKSVSNTKVMFSRTEAGE